MRATAYLGLCLRFYLGLWAPAGGRNYPDCRVRAARDRRPELIRFLVSCYRHHGADTRAQVEVINFRCARITLGDGGESFFVKEFRRAHGWHDLERWLRCSRVDRAWRAGHLLPALGWRTPGAVGTAQARAGDGSVREYLVTEWLQGATPLPQLLIPNDPGRRAAVLQECAHQIRAWHDGGLYLRDLVKNVLVTETDSRRRYWLTDLDGLHPWRRPTWRRRLFHMRQLAHWAGPLEAAEAQLIADSYLQGLPNRWQRVFRQELMSALPTEVG